MIKTDFAEYKFEKVDGTLIDDVPRYIAEKLLHHPDGEVFVGCDSKVLRRQTIFVIIIAIRYPGKGAHIIQCRHKGEKFNKETLVVRLFKEAQYVLDLGVYLYDRLNRKITMHVDISPDPQFESNRVYAGATGMLKGVHTPGRLEWAAKPYAWAAMRAADALTRK